MVSLKRESHEPSQPNFADQKQAGLPSKGHDINHELTDTDDGHLPMVKQSNITLIKNPSQLSPQSLLCVTDLLITVWPALEFSHFLMIHYTHYGYENTLSLYCGTQWNSH